VGPIRLSLAPSRALAALVLLAHGGGLVCLLAAALPAWVQAAAGATVVVSLAHSTRRYALLRAPAAVVALLEGRSGPWQLLQADGSTIEAERLPEALVHPALVILHFRAPGRRGRIVVPIAPDMIGPEEHRRLRVRLNLER